MNEGFPAHPDARSHHDALKLQLHAGPSVHLPPILPDRETRLGRSGQCEVILPDRERAVSREHAALMRRGDGWVVTDLGSRAGTFVNAVRLPAEQPIELSHGDTIRIGPWTFLVDLGEGEGEEARYAVAEATVLRGERIETVEAGLAAADRLRLEILLDCAEVINQADDEAGLAGAVLDAALDGTGFHHAAVIRPGAGADEVEVIATRSLGPGSESLVFSRSLVQAAAGGQVVRMTADAPVELGVSIEHLGITAALCVPILLGRAVRAFLYLDTRNAVAAPDPADAVYGQAIARLYGLALANLKRIEIERRQRRLEADVAAARAAQQLIVPATSARVGAFAYAVHMRPGRFVAGDLFDVVPLDDHRLAVCIGDVTGEGAGAAILMAASQAHMHAVLVSGGGPEAALVRTNHYLAARSAADKFVSMWIGVFDARAGTLRYADAGHGYWFVRRASGETELGARPRDSCSGWQRTMRTRRGSSRWRRGTGW